jgi:hypothetical protein
MSRARAKLDVRSACARLRQVRKEIDGYMASVHCPDYRLLGLLADTVKALTKLATIVDEMLDEPAPERATKTGKR